MKVFVFRDKHILPPLGKFPDHVIVRIGQSHVANMITQRKYVGERNGQLVRQLFVEEQFHCGATGVNIRSRSAAKAKQPRMSS